MDLILFRGWQCGVKYYLLLGLLFHIALCEYKPITGQVNHRNASETCHQWNPRASLITTRTQGELDRVKDRKATGYLPEKYYWLALHSKHPNNIQGKGGPLKAKGNRQRREFWCKSSNEVLRKCDSLQEYRCVSTRANYTYLSEKKPEWKWFKGKIFTIAYPNQKETWYHANQNCQELGMRLLKITDVLEGLLRSKRDAGGKSRSSGRRRDSAGKDSRTSPSPKKPKSRWYGSTRPPPRFTRPYPRPTFPRPLPTLRFNRTRRYNRRNWTRHSGIRPTRQPVRSTKLITSTTPETEEEDIEDESKEHQTTKTFKASTTSRPSTPSTTTSTSTSMPTTTSTTTSTSRPTTTSITITTSRPTETRPTAIFTAYKKPRTSTTDTPYESENSENDDDKEDIITMWLDDDKYTSMDLKWKTGQKVKFTRWAESEPQWQNGDCVVLATQTFKWYVTRCQSTHYAVCQKDPAFLGGGRRAGPTPYKNKSTIPTTPISTKTTTKINVMQVDQTPALGLYIGVATAVIVLAIIVTGIIICLYLKRKNKQMKRTQTANHVPDQPRYTLEEYEAMRRSLAYSHRYEDLDNNCLYDSIDSLSYAEPVDRGDRPYIYSGGIKQPRYVKAPDSHSVLAHNYSHELPEESMNSADRVNTYLRSVSQNNAENVQETSFIEQGPNNRKRAVDSYHPYLDLLEEIPSVHKPKQDYLTPPADIKPEPRYPRQNSKKYLNTSTGTAPAQSTDGRRSPHPYLDLIGEGVHPVKQDYLRVKNKPNISVVSQELENIRVQQRDSTHSYLDLVPDTDNNNVKQNYLTNRGTPVRPETKRSVSATGSDNSNSSSFHSRSIGAKGSDDSGIGDAIVC